MKESLAKIDLDTMATNRLRDLCIARQWVRCDECCFVEMPGGGYDVPYCKLITMIDSCCRNEGHAIIYELKEGTIPKECKFWISVKKEREKKESTKKVKHAQAAIDKLTLTERREIRI